MIAKTSMPSILIVHPMKKYDKNASARQGIQSILQSVRPAMVLQIQDGLKNEAYIKTSRLFMDTDVLPGSGLLIDKDFYNSRKLWFDTDTFVIIGGRIGRCMRNAFMSTLVYKLFEPGPLFKSRLTTTGIFNKFIRQREAERIPLNGETGAINFHFNMYASYASLYDMSELGTPAEVQWSGNMLYHMAEAAMIRNGEVVEDFGLNTRVFMNGALVNSSEEKAGKRTVNMYYWVDVPSMAKAIAASQAGV